MVSQHSKLFGGGGKGKGKKKGGKKGDKPEIIPYPKELRKKPAPADPSKPLTIEGLQIYCTHHKKWGRHISHECKAKDKDNSDSTPKNDRAGRAVTAYQAI